MKKSIVLGGLLSLSAGAAFADDFSYNNLEVGYARTEITPDRDLAPLRGNGFSLAASTEIGSNMFGYTSFTSSDYDFGLTTNWFTTGLGFHWPLSSTVELISGASFERAALKITDLATESERGYGLNAGLRAWASDRLELTGGVKYVDLGKGIDGKRIDDFTVSGGGRYYFTPAFAAGLDVSNNDDGTAFGIVLRYDFGRRN
jgi:hypothetical protein